MDKPKQKRPRPTVSAFDLAKHAGAVVAELDIDDILHLRPSWTREQAAAFLEEQAETIGAAMLSRGMEVLIFLLPPGDHYA